MAGSGQLGLQMAEAFGLSHSTVTTVIKALRSERVLSIKGRGSSAAQMTVADAAAISVGIMSGAVTAEIPTLTRRVLRMPMRHFLRAGSSAELGGLATPVPHTFLDGFAALFDDDWEDESAPRAVENRMDGVRIVLGFDGRRTEGFAVIEASDSDGVSMKNFYSTLPLRVGISDEEDALGLGLRLYKGPPKFVFAASVDGIALSVLKRALVQPVSTHSDGRSGRTDSLEGA